MFGDSLNSGFGGHFAGGVASETIHDEEDAGVVIDVDAILIGGTLQAGIGGDAGAPAGEGLHGNRRPFRQFARTRHTTNRRKRTTKGT
jgi:hypothetical protein